MLCGVRNTLMGWEVGHQTEGELVPTTAAGGDVEGRCMCAGPWIKAPNSQGREENLDTTRKEKMNSHLALWIPVLEVTLPGKVFYHSESNVACK